MIIFDFFLLVSVSVLLGLKSLYLGAITLIIGLLIGFQNHRVQLLLGEIGTHTTVARKIKAALLSLLLTGCFYPLAVESGLVPGLFEAEFNSVLVLPIIIVIGLLSATVMAALTVEKRKR